MVVQSGNYASVAIAEHISGSEDVFSAVMNQHSISLGLVNSIAPTRRACAKDSDLETDMNKHNIYLGSKLSNNFQIVCSKFIRNPIFQLVLRFRVRCWRLDILAIHITIRLSFSDHFWAIIMIKTTTR